MLFVPRTRGRGPGNFKPHQLNNSKEDYYERVSG